MGSLHSFGEDLNQKERAMHVKGERRQAQAMHHDGTKTCPLRITHEWFFFAGCGQQMLNSERPDARVFRKCRRHRIPAASPHVFQHRSKCFYSDKWQIVIGGGIRHLARRVRPEEIFPLLSTMIRAAIEEPGSHAFVGGICCRAERICFGRWLHLNEEAGELIAEWWHVNAAGGLCC